MVRDVNLDATGVLERLFRRRGRTFRQTQTTECPIAAIGMILDHHGCTVPLEELRRRAGVSRDCASAGDILRVARELGLEGRGRRAELADLATIPTPFIAHLRFIHFVVIEAVRDGLVHMNDPAAGRHARPIEELDLKFTGVVLEFTPTDRLRPGTPPPSVASLAAQGARARPLATLALAVTTLGLALAWSGAALLLARAELSASALVAMSGLAFALVVAREACLSTAALGLAATVSSRVLRHMQRLPFAFFTYRLPDDLTALVRSPVTLAEAWTGLSRAALGVAAVPLLALALAAIDPVAAALVVLVGAAHVVLGRTALRPAARRFEEMLRIRGEGLPSHIADKLSSARTGGLDDEIAAALAGDRAEALSVAHEQATVRALGAAAPRLFEGLALLAALGRGGALGLGPGPLAALALLSLAVAARARDLATDEGELEAIQDGVAPLAEVLSLPPEDPPPDRAPPADGGALRLEGVTFGYALGKPPHVDGVSLEVRPGTSLGVTGPSGGGKSTIAGLVAGLHRPWAGSATLGGRPLDAVPRSELAWIHRSPVVFEATLRENLSLFDPGLDDERLLRAARDACFEEVIAARPGGLGARLSAGGLDLSAGERQRLELARALARDPRTLILDEAIEAVEPALEARLRERLRARGVTLVVVSHRASTLAACDTVVTVEGGRVVAERAAPRDPRAGALRSPLHGEHAPPPPRGQERGADQDLAAAFARVALASDERAPPLEGPPLAPGRAAILDLARRAGLRARHVRLNQSLWWGPGRDSGPLLAFEAQGGAPVALLPAAGGGYDRVDARGRTRLTASGVEALEPFAWVLHGGLPAAARRPRDLLAHAAARTRREARRALALSIAAGLPGALLPLGTFALLAWVVPLGEAAVLVQGVVAAALALVAGALLDLHRSIAVQRLAARFEQAATAGAVDRLLALPGAFFRRLPRGELERRWRGLGQALERVSRAKLDGLSASLSGLASLGAVALLSPPLALVAAGILALHLAARALLARRVLASEERRSGEARANFRFLLEALRGAARLRSAGAEAAVASAHEARHARELATVERLHRTRRAERALDEALPLAGAAALALVAAARGADPATLAAALVGWWLACGPAVAAATWLEGATLARLDLARFAPLLEEPLERPSGGVAPGVLRGEVEARALAFRHPGAARAALESVSLSVAPGEVVALAGGSGAGKSTLLRLLLGLEQPLAGEVRYDGRSLAELDARAVRAQTGAVLQEERLATATLRSNVAFRAARDLDEVWAALRAAGLEHDVRAMPMGVQTIVEDDRVSTGQKQRLLLAAQLLRAPRVLVLDEATSAVGEDAEAALLASVRASGATCILAAHRASTLRHADRVHVLEGGRIVESGRPADLLAGDGALARLFATAQGEVPA